MINLGQLLDLFLRFVYLGITSHKRQPMEAVQATPCPLGNGQNQQHEADQSDAQHDGEDGPQPDPAPLLSVADSLHGLLVHAGFQEADVGVA